ncbi:hypothetical protein PVAND_014407 [Polypedilum vanderplanki]|uniref:Uncharacterized protein n=1 Tax=Polypedilum vanderplanki TaxID=319348 RepID=A0A9J6B930_POLVA|nr:hypothetical protein PVAND_014407 [Polypedilum vanderplanki]KAG5666378.1 hypothetical protein PVAND_014407 [Polypedilum vanderplanki]
MNKKIFGFLIFLQFFLQIISGQTFDQIYPDILNLQALANQNLNLPCMQPVLTDINNALVLCSTYQKATPSVQTVLLPNIIVIWRTLHNDYDYCMPSAAANTTTSTTTVITTPDPRSFLMPNITQDIQSLSQLLTAMNATAANPCCKLPLQQDTAMLMNMTLLLSNDLYVHSYEIEAQILAGIDNAIKTLIGNWTDCQKTGSCCIPNTTTTTPTTTTTTPTTTTTTPTTTTTTPSTTTTSKPMIDSTSAGVNDTSCIAHGLRAITRVTNNFNRDIGYSRSRAKIAQSFLMQRIFSSITTILANFLQAANNIKTNATLVRSSTFKNSLGPLQTALSNFYLGYQKSINATFANITSNVATFSSAVNSTLKNATSLLLPAITNFTQTVINNSDIYPCCTDYANSSLDVELKFANDLKLCAQAADNTVSIASLQIINNLQTYGTTFNTFKNNIDLCYNTVVNSWLILNSLLLFPAFSNKAMACINTVTTSITSSTSSISNNTNTVLISALSNFPQATQTYQTCVNTALSSALASLNNISAEYIACKRVGSCSTANNLNLQPNITALHNNLTSLMSLANVSKADPICIQSVIKDVNLLVTDLQLLSNSTGQSSTSTQLTVFSSLSSSVDLINYKFSQCKVDNRTVFIQNITTIASTLAALQNTTLNSTAYAGCLSTIQLQIAALQISTTALNNSLFTVDYSTDQNATADLETQVAALNASWTACLNFDNRTLLIPNITNDLNALYELLNETSNSTAYTGCLIPIQQTILAMINATNDFNGTIFNNIWASDDQVVIDLTNQIALLKDAWMQCQAFDNRTLLLPNITDCGQNLTDLLANITNSTAYSGCLAPIQAQLAIDMALQTNLTTDVFNYTYDIAAQMVTDLQNEISSLQAAFDTCLIFDPYSDLESNIAQAGVDLTNLQTSLLNATNGDPSCIGPLSDQLAIDLALQSNLTQTIYDYNPEIAISIVNDLQTEIILLQSAVNACLSFDAYSLLLPNITQTGVDLTNLQQLILNNTASNLADPTCTGPISDQLAMDLQLQRNLSTIIYDYPLEIAQQIISDLQAEIFALQTAYNICLTLDPFSILQASVIQAGISLTNLQSAVSNSTADRACVYPILAQIEIDLELQGNLSISINDYSFDIASQMVADLQNEIIVLQIAANACLAFDPYAPMLPNITQAGVDLSKLQNIIANCSTDASCTGPILAQINIDLQIQSQLPSTIYNYSAEQIIANSSADPTCTEPISDQLALDSQLQGNLSTIIYDYPPDIAQQIISDLQVEILALQAAFNACQITDFTQDLLTNITQIGIDLTNLQAAILNSTVDPSCTGPILAQISIDLQLQEALPNTIHSYDLQIANSIVIDLQNDILNLLKAYNGCLAFDPYSALRPLLNQTAVDLLTIEMALLNSTADSACLLPIQGGLVQNMQLQLQLQSYLTDYPPDIAEAMVSDLQTQIKLLNVSIQTCIAFDPRIGLYDVINGVALNLTAMASQLMNSKANLACAADIETTLSAVAELLLTVNSTILNNTYTDDVDNVASLVQAAADLQQAWTLCQNYDNRTDFYVNITAFHTNLTALADAIVLSGLNWPCVDEISKSFVYLYDVIAHTNSTLLIVDYNTDLQTIQLIQDSIDQVFLAWQSCATYDPRVQLFIKTNEILGNLSTIADQIVNSTADALCAIPIEMTVSEIAQLAYTINSTILNISFTDGQVAVNNLSSSIVNLQEAWTLCQNYDNRTDFVYIIEEAMKNLTAIGENITLSGLTWPCVNEISQSFIATSDLINQINSTLFLNNWTTDNETVAAVFQIITDLKTAWDACSNYDPRVEFFNNMNDIFGNLSTLANQIVNSTANPICASQIEIALSAVAEVALNVNSTILNNTLASDQASINNISSSVNSLQQAWIICQNYDNRSVFINTLAEARKNLTNIGENVTLSSLTWPCVGDIALSIVGASDIIQQINSTLFINDWTSDNDSVASLINILQSIELAWDACYNYDPRSVFFDVINNTLANLTAIGQNISVSNVSDSCLSSINDTLVALFDLTISINSTILNVTFDVDQQAILGLTSSVEQLRKALILCENFDNRTEFYFTTAELKANLSDLAVSLLNSTSIASSCQAPIDSSYVQLYQLLISINASITTVDYATDAQNIAILVQAFSELQKAWILCQAYNPLDDIANSNNQLIAELNALINTANTTAGVDQTCSAQVISDIQAFLQVVTNFNDTLYTSNYTYTDAKNVSDALTSGYTALQKEWDACLSVPTTVDPRIAVLQQISNTITQIQSLQTVINSSSYDAACLANLNTNCTETTSLLQPVVDAGLSNDLTFLQTTASLAQASYAELMNGFVNCSTVTSISSTIQFTIIASTTSPIVTEPSSVATNTPKQSTLAAVTSLPSSINSTLFLNNWTTDNETVAAFFQIITDLKTAWDACSNYDPRVEFFNNMNDIFGNLSTLANQIVNSTANPICASQIEIALSAVAEVALNVNSTILNNTLASDQASINNISSSVNSSTGMDNMPKL